MKFQVNGPAALGLTAFLTASLIVGALSIVSDAILLVVYAIRFRARIVA